MLDWNWHFIKRIFLHIHGLVGLVVSWLVGWLGWLAGSNWLAHKKEKKSVAVVDENVEQKKKKNLDDWTIYSGSLNFSWWWWWWWPCSHWCLTMVVWPWIDDDDGGIVVVVILVIVIYQIFIKYILCNKSYCVCLFGTTTATTATFSTFSLDSIHYHYAGGVINFFFFIIINNNKIQLVHWMMMVSKIFFLVFVFDFN